MTASQYDPVICYSSRGALRSSMFLFLKARKPEGLFHAVPFQKAGRILMVEAANQLPSLQRHQIGHFRCNLTGCRLDSTVPTDSACHVSQHSIGFCSMARHPKIAPNVIPETLSNGSRQSEEALGRFWKEQHCLARARQGRRE